MKPDRLEPFVVILVLLVAMALNMAAFVNRSFVTPADKTFAGTQFYSDDYAVYVSYVRQGQQGRWTTVDRFTSEPHPPALIHEEYLLWGKLTGLFKIPPVLSYHLARMVWGIIFLLALYALLIRFFPKKKDSVLRVGSFVLATLSAGFFERVNNKSELYLSWLTDLDPTQRFGPVPHYLLGFICLLVILAAFYSLSDEVGKKRRKSILIIALAGLIGGFVLPSSLVVAVSTLAIFGLSSFLAVTLTRRSEYWRNIKLSAQVILVLFLVNLPSLLYYRKIFQVSPWSHILAWERVNRGDFTLEKYLLALGPVAFLVPLGWLSVRRETKAVLFLTSWWLTVFLWSFRLADLTGLNPTRFLQSLVYVPMAVLTALGLRQTAVWLAGKVAPRAVQTIFLVLVAGVLLIGLPALRVSLKSQFAMYNNFSGLIYPEKDLVDAYRFLEAKTGPDEAVLTLYQSGNLIPFMAGNTTYLGHLQETINFNDKVDRAALFYTGTLDEEKARSFLDQNHLSLVFYSPQERSVGGKIDEYSFLEPIFENQAVTVYRYTDQDGSRQIKTD